MAKKHQETIIKCSCGLSVRLSSIQYDDFDCGMMGFLYCPDCKTTLMPSKDRTAEEITEDQVEVEGEDKGWC